MIITKLEYQKKDNNRVSIFIDDQFAFGCDIKFLIDYSLIKDRVITEDEIIQIIRRDYEHTLYRRSINYLSRGLKTVYQMRSYLLKLLKKGENQSYHELSKEEIENLIRKVIDQLMSEGLLDDREYVLEYLRSVTSRKSISRNYLLGKLSQKGIDRKFAESIISEISDEYIDENRAISELLMKKYGKKTLTSKDQKEIRYLQGKGFEWDNISRFIER